MAVAFVRQSTYVAGSFKTSHSITLTGTPAADNTLILTSYSANSASAISAVSGCGATWTLVLRQSGAPGALEMWVGTPTSGAAGPLTVTFPATAAMVINVSEFSGLAGTFGTPASANGNSTAVDSGTVTPAAGDLVVSLMGDAGTGTVTPADTPAVFTALTGATASNYRDNSAYRIATSAVAHARTWTKSVNALWMSMTVAFPAATGGVNVSVPTATATAAGLAPTVALGPIGVSVPTAHATAAGLAPAVTVGGLAISVPTAHATAAGLAPTVTAGPIPVSVPTAHATAAGLAPSVDLTTAGAVAVSVPTAHATATALVPDVTVSRGEIVTGRAFTPMGARAIVELTTVEDLPQVEPIRRHSVLMQPLSALHQVHGRRDCAFGDDEVIRSVIGTIQLWIGGRNISYWRGVPVVVKRWESESPIGDTAAAFELPQRNPWDVDGVGDLDFLYPDAPVSIGLRREVAPGVYQVQRLWSGYLDARGHNLTGEDEGYAYEAKGTLTAALHANHEPRPFTEPTDIWVLIARALNGVIGRRWSRIPETPIGIPTLTRGSRDDKVWDYVQTLLSEAITDDGRQWTIDEVAPGIIRPVLKPAPSTVHATVAYGTPGVGVELRTDESTRVDGYFVSGIAPDGGGWANVYFPGLELINPPAYPNSDASNMAVGQSDSDTDSGSGVSDFQRRVNEIGTLGRHAVSGTFTPAWDGIIRDLQRLLHITVDGSPGPQTWNALFDRGGEGINLTPLRLPLAVKPWVMPRLYSATGVDIGPNPLHDPTRVPRFVPLQLPARKTKREGARIARTLLAAYGEAGAYGQITWEYDPNETDRARLSHLSNIEVLGFEGSDRVVQVSHKAVTLEDSDDGPAYVVTTDVDEHARDAMWVEDLLEQRRNAQPDLSRRQSAGGRSSRIVVDERGPWDRESPCGVLRRTAVNGASGLWSLVTIPFAEVGKLAGIDLKGTRPFAFAIFASLRLTENRLQSIVGNPFDSTDPWRAHKDELDEFGIIEAWGEKDDACGYSPGDDGTHAFTGRFELNTPVDYWTETPHLVQIGLFMRGGSGFVEGRFLPAYEGS